VFSKATAACSAKPAKAAVPVPSPKAALAEMSWAKMKSMAPVENVLEVLGSETEGEAEDEVDGSSRGPSSWHLKRVGPEADGPEADDDDRRDGEFSKPAGPRKPW